MSLDRSAHTADPTYTISALQTDYNAKQLGLTSSLQECLQAHVNGAPPGIRGYLDGLPKAEITEDDAGVLITTAFKAVHTPAKMISTSSPTPATPVVAVPSDLSNREGMATSAKKSDASTSNPNDPMKQLLDSAKLSATTGIVQSFLKCIIECQSSEFKAHLEDLSDEHPLYMAVRLCDLRKFRSELEKVFDDTYPRVRRKSEILKEIGFLQYNENEDLLTYRSKLIKLKKRADELLSHPEFTLHKEYVFSEFSTKAMDNINQMRNNDIRGEVTYLFAGKTTLSIGMITMALQDADKNLRIRYPTAYPPRPISVHNALESTSGNVCPACKAMFNKDWEHTLANCLGNPTRKGYEGWIRKWNEMVLAATGKPPGVFKGRWPPSTYVPSPRTKRASDGPRSPTPPLKKERGI